MAFGDTFVEASSDTNLESHTPTGGVGGTGWTRQDGAAGSAVVHSADDTLHGDSTTASSFICDDQGSADHETWCKTVSFDTAYQDSYVCARLVDKDNFIAFKHHGTAPAGRKLVKNVAGVVTDLDTSQGVADEWLKVKAEGTTITFYEGGTGASPGTWNVIATISSVTDHQTETSQGVVVANNSTSWIDDFNAASLGGATITSTDTPVARGETSVTITGTDFGSTQGTGTVTFGTESCDIDSWADTSIDVTIPSTIALQHDATGYTFIVTADDASSDTSSAVPFNEPAGWDYTDLTDPVTTLGSILYGYTGDTPVTGDQAVYETPTNPTSITFTVGTDGEWVLDSEPTVNQDVDVYVIQADGTIGTTSTITYAVGPPSGSRNTWDEIATYLRTTGYTGNNNDVIKAWLEATTSTTGHINDLWLTYLQTTYPNSKALPDAYKLWKDA